MLISILAYFGIAYLPTRYFKVKFTYSLPASLSLIIVFLYICAMCELLFLATYLVYIVGMVSFCTYVYLDRKELRYCLKQYWGEITILLCVILIYAVYTRNAYFSSWDDFSFWGEASKELLLSNAFEKQDMFTSIFPIHAHYPRGPAVYHYFMLLCSGYSEAKALLAHFIFHLIFLAPLMANKNFWHSIFIITPILAIIMLYTTGIRSIYNDSTIGLMFCSIVAIYILETNNKRAIIASFPIFVLLPLFREIGLILALISASIIIFKDIRGSKESKLRYNFILYLLILCAPIMSNFLWASYFRDTHDFFGRTEHSFSNLLVLAKSFNEQSLLLVINYVKFLAIFLIKEGSLLIYVLIGFSWYAIRRSKNKEYAEEYKFYFKITLIFGLLFALWRLYLYFFAFSYSEAIKTASLIRYLGCYCLIFAIIASVYIKKVLQDYNLKRKEFVALLVIFILSLSIVVNQTIRIQTSLNPSQLEFILRAKDVGLLIKHGIKPQFNFTNKKESFDCFNLNYAMAPYLNDDERNKCFAEPISYNTENKLPSEALPQNDLDRCINNKQNCKVEYFPFLSKIKFYLK